MADLKLKSLCSQRFREGRFNRHPYLSVFILGGIASLAFAPLHLFFLLVPCFLGLLTLIENKPPKQGLRLGWTFGFGHFIGGLYWIHFAFETAGLTYFGPLAVVSLAGLLAIFPALVCALTVLWPCDRFSTVWIFSSLWVLMEWLRSYILTGFPWNLMGYTWTISMLQSTAWIGIYGLSLITVLAATSMYSRSFKMVLSFALIITGLCGAGQYRLLHAPILEHKDINIRLVQASIPQQLKWLPQERVKNLLLYLNLSHLQAEKPLKAIIWPEAAVTIPLNQDLSLGEPLKKVIPENGVLITGGIRVLYESDDRPFVFNCLYMLNDQGKIIDSYDKHHLAPFGEYVPFKDLIGLEKLTHGSLDYQAGPKPRVLSSSYLPPFQPLICYEGIFPQLVLGGDVRAQWLLSLTNDTWFGQSFGPYQHLAIVCVRAIEHGMPLARVANNGISAVIDSYGRVLHQLGLNQVGYIDFTLPQALLQPTFYSQWREVPFIIMVVLSLFIGCVCRVRRKRN